MPLEDYKNMFFNIFHIFYYIIIIYLPLLFSLKNLILRSLKG